MGAIALIEVIIGLVFVVLLTSIIVALVNEIIVTNLNIRSKLLKKSIGRMLNDSTHNEVIGDNFYNHPLIKKLTKNKHTLPSYISPATFSKVLVDTLHGYGERTNDIKATISKLPENSDTKVALLTLLNDANNDVDKFKGNVEEWFNESMTRLSGWYKRYTQIQLFVIGFFIAMVLNIDIIHIAKELSDDKEKRIQIVEAARDYVRSKEDNTVTVQQEMKDAIQADEDKYRDIHPVDTSFKLNEARMDSLKSEVVLKEMTLEEYDAKIADYEKQINAIKSDINPLSGLVGIFWNGKVAGPVSFFKALKNVPLSAPIGWMITALAASLGSAFWFDMLKKLINIRGSVKPEKAGK